MKDGTVLDHASRNFLVLRQDWTFEYALREIRQQQVPGPILYFYVTDDSGKLVGVLPTRALLVAPLDAQLKDHMVKRVLSLPQHMAMSEASEFFVLHRFLALPIVDKDKHVVGVIDVNAFTDEVLDVAERRNFDTVFEAIGLRVGQAKDASPVRAFRLRFPWLIATICGGTVCALLAGVYGATLEKSIVLAFFLTLVLGLGESVAAQSMTLAVQLLRTDKPTLRWFASRGGRELATALLLGLVCGATVGLIAGVWQGFTLAPLAIGASIAVSIVCAALLGLGVPTVLHALKLDPRVAAGPITLAMTDLATLAIYFNAGMLLLG
ncbi:MAG: magnesium transporter [Planctomycetes bacterium]|nr:magnesium transporter [Planctomycetota bacterium]MCW8137041.1 magnesium transporter [Planctomycetota bacterium]